ncbi:MAG: hypothetical protein LIO65_00860 [Odoribacter sp.]|nr:hypothetical protein [Odoribacter sp.]
MEKNLTFLRNTANNYIINSYWEEMEQAYRLYVLALSGRPYLAAMNRMKELELKNNTA